MVFKGNDNDKPWSVSERFADNASSYKHALFTKKE